MKKHLYLLTLLLLCMFAATGCQNSLYERDAELQAASEVTVQEPEFEPEPEPTLQTEYSEKETSQIATEYKKKWQQVEHQLSTLEASKDTDGVRRYSENNNLRKIEIDQETYGTMDMDFEREYFFDDAEMYFARLTSGSKEMRFYFKNGQLIRWIDAGGKAYDKESHHKDFSNYELQLYSEAADLWSEFDSEQAIVNSYIQ